MEHNTPLITMIVAGFGLAFLFGTIANRFRVPPLVGYLLAGVIVGPFTPGFVADADIAAELAEIGIILLMFGVGLHFSLEELLSVKSIAIPGAIVQIAVATALGVGLSQILGWNLAGGIIFGLALSVASTVVLLRAMEERRLLPTERGRIAVGWLIVEDLATVFALVLIPALLGGMTDAPTDGEGMSAGEIAFAFLFTLGKVAAFIGVMLVVGRRVIPWTLHYTAHTGSRELFRLAVLAVAMTVAYGASELFGVSFALGAFFAGMILAESPLSQSATKEALPFRDAFAVLYFVSVGMLFDPGILLREPWSLLATIFIIIVGKSLAAYGIVRAFGHPSGTALTISASLAQIGEFSFILAGLGVSLGHLPEDGRDLILAGSIISILLNPALFELIERFRERLAGKAGPDLAAAPAPPLTAEPLVPSTLKDHVIVVGYGRVGKVIAARLRKQGVPFLVVEEQSELAESASKEGMQTISGNAATEEVLNATNVGEARSAFIAIPNGFEAGQIVSQAKKIRPGLRIVARSHSDAETEHLSQLGADTVIMGEREIALGMFEAMFGTQAQEPQQQELPLYAPGV